MAESEAETPSTPGEFESKYFEFHGVRLPPFCRGKMEEIANFPVRPSDVWIVTYPKSGTSLLQEVVYLVSQGADPDEIGLMNIDEQLPVLEYPQPGLDIIKELTSPRLIKSHLPYRFLPSDLHSGDSKVIYMARNPKDLVVSYYQFHRSLRTMSYRGTFQEFCRRFMNDKLGYGSWFEHVQEFWEHRMDSNVLFLKYEDMHRQWSDSRTHPAATQHPLRRGPAWGKGLRWQSPDFLSQPVCRSVAILKVLTTPAGVPVNRSL
nr:sulfotransferase 4A1 isoform X3 [Kogia breviceps]